jgi:phage shock protein PspC (stress-responsive transcriptional regulator)
MPRRLTRDTGHAVLGGVAAGLAEYFGVDPVLARLVFILLAMLNGFGLIAYVICWVVMPRREEAGDGAGREPTRSGAAPVDRVVEKVREAGERLADEFRRMEPGERRGRVLAGAILIGLGAVFLLDRLPWWHWPQWARLASLWPVILIVVGASIIWQAFHGKGR